MLSFPFNLGYTFLSLKHADSDWWCLGRGIYILDLCCLSKCRLVSRHMVALTVLGRNTQEAAFIIPSPCSFPGTFFSDPMLFIHWNVSDGILRFCILCSAWSSESVKAEVGLHTLRTHSPFPWIPEAVWCEGKVVQTWANILEPIPLLPASRCRCECSWDYTWHTKCLQF